MKKLVIVITALLLFGGNVNGELVRPPDPEFNPVDFLLLPGIEQFTLDYALSWSDSAAGLFLMPVDAVVLHVEIEGDTCDIFVFSHMPQDGCPAKSGTTS